MSRGSRAYVSPAGAVYSLLAVRIICNRRTSGMGDITMKVIKSEESILEFDNGLIVWGDGDQDCCAYNYLDFEQLPVGTELPNMTAGQFVDKITLKDDGFAVKDIEGTPKWVQARSSQNGYYSSITTLFVKDKKKEINLGALSGELE